MTFRFGLAKILFLFSVTGVLLFPACASTPLICLPSGAHDAGFSMATRGEAFNSGAGAVCENENKAVFRQNFENGYQEGKLRHCDPNQVLSDAKNIGATGKKNTFDEAAYLICENITDVRTAFSRGIKLGLASFCSDEEVTNRGVAFGEKGMKTAFSADDYSVCGQGQTAHLARTFNAGFERGLAKFCRPTDLKERAFNEGSRGAEETNVETQFAACPTKTKAQLTKIYRDEFERGLNSQFCTQAKIEEDARQKAQVSGSPHFNETFARCLRKNPQLKTAFLTAFNEERRQVVAARCSYQNGVAQGQTDAQSTNSKRTNMPDYCETSLFGVYLSGYLEGWKQTKDRICESAGAYSEGVEDGRTGRTLGFVMPPNCPEEYRVALEQRYREGLRESRLQGVEAYNGYGYGGAGNFNSNSNSGVTYSPAIARSTCSRMSYGEFACSRVTSVACIEKHYHPNECAIPSDYMNAVDACIRKGFPPSQCHRVKDRACIDSGRLPENCQRAPSAW